MFHGDGGFDEFIGEGGDDIWFGSLGRGKFDGMSGYDWTTYDGMKFAVNVDLSIQISSPGLRCFRRTPRSTITLRSKAFGLRPQRRHPTVRDVTADACRCPATKASAAARSTPRASLSSPACRRCSGAGVTVRSVGGNILLGGDGSDLIEGRGGDDIIDGDRWLDVRIAVFAADDPNPTGTPIALHNSMTTLAPQMFAGTINPGQLGIVRTIRNDQPADSDGLPDVDVAGSPTSTTYTITANDDGTISVAHVTVTERP